MKNFFKQRSMLRYFVECWTKKIVKFNGRASRKEYLGFILYSILVFCISLLVPPVAIIYLVASLLPYLAVTFRRLHDTENYPKLDFQKDPFIRIATFIVTHIFIIGFLYYGEMFSRRKGDEGPNKYGSDPRYDFPVKKKKTKKNRFFLWRIFDVFKNPYHNEL